MVITDKSVYFSGEPIKAKVVLGRYDKSTVPTSVVVNGSQINLSNPNTFSDGQVQLNMTAGSLGEHKFTGKFTFIEEGVEVPVAIENSNYVVVERPNSATIAADKMNVVYMMLDNPISASFSGVSNDKVNVTASSGSLKKVGPGKYVLKPAAGKTVTITATGTLPDGKTVSDKKEFRIKQIPAPRGTIRGEYAAKGSAENLKIATIGAKMEDFDFDVKIVTTGFTIVFPNNLGSVAIQGTNLNEEARRKVDRLRPGDIIRITDIKTRIEGVEMMMKKPSDATFQIL
jgi:gliding motility-associated protein GldM